ncbi:C2 domain-containing protein 3 [Genypterus blacodes]|uniref:C2 domain-containing protein 3 n=1 Tax=Genypterus blacodes TaxID=154954 RepID=UPI003F757F6E
MKNRSLKTKSGGSRVKVPSDVSPSTSLPPLVEGQLQCFLRVTVSRVIWTAHKPPSPTFVRLRWWGESSNGTHFFPRDGSQGVQKTVKTTARFCIRCCPKQFTSYLKDMDALVLEVLTKSDHLPIACAQVPGVCHLSPVHPICGFYTLVSPTSEKLGEIQVSLAFEPLAECSSVSTTDASREAPRLTTQTGPSQSRTPSAGSNAPRGRDHLYFQSAQKDTGREESPEKQRPTTNRSQKNPAAANPSTQEPCHTVHDLLSVISERGSKLKDAIVTSSLNCEVDSATTLKENRLPLPKDSILPPSKCFQKEIVELPSLPLSWTLLQNILHADSSRKPPDDAAAASDCVGLDVENIAADLLLGSLNTSVLLWEGDGSLPESLSGHSSVCEDSDLDDPQYDQSLLENLFYKTTMSDIRPDDTEVEVESKQSSDKQLTQSGLQLSENPPLEPEQSRGVDPPVSIEKLTTMRLARVTIDSLSVHTDSVNTTPRKSLSKGKPPRTILSKKCFYFVEYVFPVASTSRRHSLTKVPDREVTRAVSCKVTGGVVKFQQHNVFPVHLNSTTVKLWWGTDLIFKIYSRKTDQKKPLLIGEATHPLRCLLESKQLSHSLVLTVQSVEGICETQQIGPLKVSVELAADSKSFSSERNKSREASSVTFPSHITSSPHGEPSRISQHVQTGTEELAAASTADPRLDVCSSLQASIGSSPPSPGVHTFPQTSWQQVVEEDPEVLLHSLLMVPDGKNFHCGPMEAPNVYLNCKLFWPDEQARSVVSWGQANPAFNFVQVTPVILTVKLLERMKNNVIVIEVWQKTRLSGQDQLLGLAKLPLHQFYLSFRDPKIAHLLLQAQFPVLGVDCYVPVIDVFSGCKGNLRVILAMGRSEQIHALQRVRGEECDRSPHLVRPAHLLDHQHHSQAKVSTAHKELMTEHVFLITVEKVRGLTPLQSTVWAEADCYVQYTFPYQQGNSAAELDHSLIESTVNLKAFRTITTLCVPDPVFNHNDTHVLLAPEGVPVQRLLLSSLSGQGLAGGGGVQFEVWCRYYYPNVRDQVVAKGMLPLSKLCAMVTMQREKVSEAQMFCLPLVPWTESHRKPQPSGLLDVCIQYKRRPLRPEGHPGRGAASRVVTLMVQVHRASGLQAAARLLSEQDERFQYYAAVGVNAYVTVQLSLLPERERRSTRTVARTFCPDFDYHMEVPCDLLVHRSSGETCSLAEQLEEASALFTIWNRDSRKAIHTPKYKDVKLGAVKIPLVDLIHKARGIWGWFGVYAAQDTHPSHDLLVGGLNVSVNFSHHSERERVIKAAEGLAWEMTQSGYERLEDEEVWEESTKTSSLTFAMPRAWIPVHCLLLPGQTELQRSTYCYFRYKFYDQEAFCSQLKHPTVEDGREEGQATVSFQGTTTVKLKSTQPLMWYLREERLEVQVWVTFRKDKILRPHDMDRLVGSAFVDLASLAKKPKQKLIVSGVYPLFRRSAADLRGAALRVHITLTTGHIPAVVSTGVGSQMDSDSQEELSSEEEETIDGSPPADAPTKLASTPSKPQNKSPTPDIASRLDTPDIAALPPTEISLDETFPASVTVDRTMHLDLKGCPLAELSGVTPCCCVSYATADSTVSTPVIANTDSPVWNHYHECRLSKHLLLDPQQPLVFEVWHKGEIQRVIGFASIGLSPLTYGFPSVCGWYNITDLSGQCHGQLKVSITPLKSLEDLREQRKAVIPKSNFPSHISRYPQQKRSSESDHMENVRLYHQSLQEQVAAQCVRSSSSSSRSVGDLNPSSSALFSALRKNLSELDNIHRYFSHKISADQERNSREEEQQDSETDTGLFGRHWETTVSNSLRGSTPPPAGNNNSLIFIDMPSSPRASEVLPEDASPLSSPPLRTPENHTDSEEEEEDDDSGNGNGLHQAALLSEDENYEGEEKESDETECKRVSEVDGGQEEDYEEDDDEDQDYEKVVVEPRHLNEVTSLTDRTSPWTSIMSDPDLVSLESLEVPEEPEPNQEEEMRTEFTSQTDDVITELSPSRKHNNTTPERCECHHSDHSDHSDHSVVSQDTDTDTDDEATQQPGDEGQANEPDGAVEEPSDIRASPAPCHASEVTHAASPFSPSLEASPQPSVSVELLNLFLPSHHLEASMRAIRLAPSFSQASPDPGPSLPGRSVVHQRGRRQRPSLSPVSLKRETARIAQIFAGRPNEDR